MSKIKKVRTRKRGKSYSYIFEAGKKPDGKRNVVEKGGFDTEEKAYNAGIEALNAYLHGNIAISSDRILFTDYMEQWLEKVHKSAVAPHVYDMQVSCYRNRIAPAFQGMYLQDIKPAHIDALLRILIKDGLAKNSILSYKSILHSALNYAVYPAEFISVNPASLVKIPNNVATNIVERKIISPETYKKIINDKQLNPAERLVAIIAYHTGMRIAEILGLTWECIDLDRGLIKVAYQVIRYKGQRYFTSKLKRLSSYRDIYIDQDLVDLLKMWHDKQLKYTSPFSIINYVEGIPGQIHIQTQKYLPENVIPVHFVCLSNKGKLVSYSNVAGKLKKYNLNTHSFRHTHATMLVESGAPLKGITSRLGHKNVGLTQDIYTHASETIQQNTRDSFQEVLNKNNADKD